MRSGTIWDVFLKVESKVFLSCGEATSRMTPKFLTWNAEGKGILIQIQMFCSWHASAWAFFSLMVLTKSHSTHSCISTYRLCWFLISGPSHTLFLWPKTLFILLLTSLTSLPNLLLIHSHTVLKPQLGRQSGKCPLTPSNWGSASAKSAHSTQLLPSCRLLNPY